MRHAVHRFIYCFAAVVATGLIAPAFAAKAPPAKSSPAKAFPVATAPLDLSGVWVLEGATIDVKDPTITGMVGRTDGPMAGVTVGENSFFVPGPQLKGEYAKRKEDQLKMAAKGKSVDDPNAECIAQGMPEFWFGPYAWEFLQGSRQLYIFQEWNDQSRRIYLDGRKHPSLDDADPSYNGHSVGHWEGKVLVIDTANLSTDTGVWGGGSHGHSEEMHIVERIQLRDPDTMEVKVTVEDPKAFVEPWHLTRVLKRKTDLEILEFNCNVNNRHKVDADGTVNVVIKPQ